jgi:hypothetical protein
VASEVAPANLDDAAPPAPLFALPPPPPAFDVLPPAALWLLVAGRELPAPEPSLVLFELASALVALAPPALVRLLLVLDLPMSALVLRLVVAQPDTAAMDSASSTAVARPSTRGACAPDIRSFRIIRGALLKFARCADKVHARHSQPANAASIIHATRADRSAPLMRCAGVRRAAISAA